MKHYAGHTRGSGVAAYELGPGYIDVRFEDNSIYRYDHERPGRHHVDAMCRLAEEGAKLNTYINKFVRGNFAARLQ